MNDQSSVVSRENGAPGQLVVALYGSSLMVAGVAQRLGREASVRTVAIDGPTLASALGPLDADALVVDLGAVSVESALAQLRDRPELLLVGVEASGARLLVLSGERASSIATDDLVALIQHPTTNTVVTDGGMS